MRAVYQRDLISEETCILRGECAHHLINVVRIITGEELLLLNGKGLKVFGRVGTVSKREVEVKKVSSEHVNQNQFIDLALGLPKKEALELCLKQAVELGVGKILLIRSDYSQIKLPESNRLESLLISALEQSNAAFMPELINMSWDNLPFNDYTDVIVLDSQGKESRRLLCQKGNRNLLVVGPEGGFSPTEMQRFRSLANVKALKLPTPILRTPTAVATGVGFILGSLID